MNIEERRKRLPEELRYHPERKKGCLSDAAGKGDADSRTSIVDRRPKLARIFGEKCMRCYNNSKEQMSDGTYWCNTCERRFVPL